MAIMRIHAHQAPPSSSSLASKILGVAGLNGDDQLSVSEIDNVLGASGATDTLSSAISKLDTNGDGRLSATELRAAIDGFRTARHWGGADPAAQSPSTQAVTA